MDRNDYMCSFCRPQIMSSKSNCNNMTKNVPTDVIICKVS